MSSVHICHTARILWLIILKRKLTVEFLFALKMTDITMHCGLLNDTDGSS